MGTKYRGYTDQRVTPQSEALPGQVQNSAGGHAFPVDDWTRLRRFLILGSEGGTYYVGAKKLTVDNAQCVARCLKQDGERVVDEIVAVSDHGFAPSNDPALFALAMATACDDTKVKQAALLALPKVARIGTHLFHFVEFVEGFRGWGRGLKQAIQKWYLDMPLDRLVDQVLKYKQRDGWSHRDLLRLSHAKADDQERNSVFKFAVTGDDATEYTPARITSAGLLQGELLPLDERIRRIKDDRLPREVVPSEMLDKAPVWDALLESMPMTAMIRNLGKMTQVGLLTPGSDAANTVMKRLVDEERLQKARIHPFSVLLALTTYQKGSGVRGKLTWDPNARIVDALDESFYLSFGTVRPSGGRILIGLDVSSSMTWNCIANSHLSASVGAAAMCMTTVRVEEDYNIMAFSGNFVPITISPKQRLDDVIRMTDAMTFGRTDCSLPILWALKNKVEVDTFIIYTDNETWAGSMHPVQALRKYRDTMGIPAKLVVAGMTATEFSIANPNDAGSLDVVGFDASAPNVISDFVRGNL